MGLGLNSDSESLRKREFRMPHPPVRLALLLTLEEAIEVAWSWLHAEPWEGFDAKKAIEVDYTAHLHIILQDHLLGNETVEGFTNDTFLCIERIETVNFDGTKKSKRPDLIARLAYRPNTRRSQDGIFIECKRVDATHSLLTDYCDAGLDRFLVGDYAWAMTEALMVGYNTIRPKPSVALAKPFETRAKQIQVIGKLHDCKNSPHKPPVAISKHKRSFPLKGKQASAIKLRHLWLIAP